LLFRAHQGVILSILPFSWEGTRCNSVFIS